MDIDIIGGSIAGLSTAISLKNNKKKNINVVLFEKNKNIQNKFVIK